MPDRLTLVVLVMLVAATGLWLFLQPLLQSDSERPADAAATSGQTVTERHAVGSEFRDCETCPVMVVIPAGSFMMDTLGSQTLKAGDEAPQREVSIPRDFAVGKFEVTFAEWDACVSDGGCGGYQPGDEGWGRGNRPVIYVSWEDAQAYVAWLNQRTGKAYRLLSEAEWEYAARAGTTTAFPWGAKASHENANYGTDICCSGVVQGRDEWMNTSPAGSFPANGFGLHDMHGNVWELTQDCYVDDEERPRDDSVAGKTGECLSRVLRGGSWLDFPRLVRPSTYRLDLTPGNRGDNHGFRVARNL
jgi:formylglycine-generating enzyme required for sulfatase activity